MTTKELGKNKICLFCASDYHLEMILLPYIKERINTSKFVIISQKDLEPTMKVLLNRVNIDEKIKKRIWNLNWKEKDISKIEDFVGEKKEINIIINGEFDYIKNVNNYIKRNFENNLTVIDCFHVSDVNVNIEELSKEYKYILNTRKI